MGEYMRKSKFVIYIVLIFALFSASFTAGYYYNKHTSSKAVMANKTNAANKSKANVAIVKKTEVNQEISKNEPIKVVDGPITQKEIFLTIDDGPSINNTPKIIDILNENGVKATFFVIGKNAEKSPEMLKKLNDNGMCIIAHSYTHDYKIYKSIQTYMEDLDKCNQVIKNTIGIEPLPFTRFPGGSDNRVSNLQTMSSIRQAVKARGIYYVDWNVSSADAAPGHVTAQQIENNMISQCKERKFVVSLMHDAPDKATTAEALPYVIKNLKEQGFMFRTFKDITPTEIKEMENLKVIYR